MNYFFPVKTLNTAKQTAYQLFSFDTGLNYSEPPANSGRVFHSDFRKYPQFKDYFFRTTKNYRDTMK